MLGNWEIHNYEIIIRETGKTIQKCVSVLDVGCGSGLVLRMLSGILRIDIIVGVDISKDKLKGTRRRDIFGVILADAAHLPFRRSSFNCVFLKDLLHHVENAVTCLREIKWLCSGSIVIVEANKNNPIMILARSFRPEEKHFSPNELKSLIARSGLRIESFGQIHVYPFDFVISSKNPVTSIWNAFIGKLVFREYPTRLFEAFLLFSRALVRIPSYNIITCH